MPNSIRKTTIRRNVLSSQGRRTLARNLRADSGGTAGFPTLATDHLELLGRWPSEAARYAAWADVTRESHGSVTNYICHERLGWQPIPEAKRDHYNGCIFAYASATPFEDPSDYCILKNDWPYRWDAGIMHLCVWLKNRIPVEQNTGKVSIQGRKMISEFVARTFIAKLGNEGEGRVLWFKNWSSLQSVGALEHFHVLLRDVPDGMISAWTSHRSRTHESQ